MALGRDRLLVNLPEPSLCNISFTQFDKVLGRWNFDREVLEEMRNAGQSSIVQSKIKEEGSVPSARTGTNRHRSIPRSLFDTPENGFGSSGTLRIVELEAFPVYESDTVDTCRCGSCCACSINQDNTGSIERASLISPEWIPKF